MKAPLLLLACVLGFGCASIPLEEEPWHYSKPGTHILGAGAGYGWADFDIEIEGTGGFLDGRSGADGGDLRPKAGGALRYQYIVNDNLRLGAALEVRRVKPDKVAPLGIGAILPTFAGDRFTVYHLMFQPRWYFEPFGETRRWRMFTGIDLAWLPGVDIDGDVVYGGGVTEPLSFRGDDYFTLAPVVGCSYLLTDRWTFDFGALYEFPLGTSEDELPLLIVNSQVSSEVAHEGLILFWTFSYSF